MTTPAFVLPVVVVIALGTATACCGGWQEPEAIPFGASEELAAVYSIYGCRSFGAVECWLAAGSDGTVVWAYGSVPGQVIEYEVGSVDLGDAALTAVLSTASGWWVVGKDATVALSEDEGDTWQTIDPGTSADLYGIVEHADGVVIIGDDVIVVRQPNDSWTEAPPHQGGWGRLRGIYSDGFRVYTVGLGGRAWSAADPDGEWVSEDIGVETDLFAVGRARDEPDLVGIVGAQGTLVVGDHDREWSRVAASTTIDFVDVSNSRILAADGEVFDYIDGKLSSIDTTFSGAKALHSDGLNIAVVGDKGRAQRLYRVRCGF